MTKYADNGPMLNAYPDSVGGTLRDIVSFLKKPEAKDIFSSFYILPSIFNTDLDRGFSVISYDISEMLGSREDLEDLKALGMDLKLDFILNHISVLSKQFQDIVKNGEESKYRDFFIDWNRFWEGCGEMTADGYIQPDPEYIKDMFFRKPGLPILMVRFPDGRDVPYWNTFYQEVKYPVLTYQTMMEIFPGMQYQTADTIAKRVNAAISSGTPVKELDFAGLTQYREKTCEYLEANRSYLGQMDLNIKSDLVWEYYDDVLRTLASYGTKIVRLDAFAYAPKEPGEKNFLNEPGTWDLLAKVQAIADKYGLKLLPEIHASYGEKNYKVLADKGYMTYDFFLPGLILDAIDHQDGSYLKAWADELIRDGIRTVNMLGCHDGIPLLDLRGLLPEDRIQEMIDTVVGRGGYVKDLHGNKNMYYQVNATYYSALGEDDRKLLLARALQLFMPGKPQVWYLDLFAGKNDHEAVKRAGAGGHKEINRTNLSPEDVEERLALPVVQKQLEMLRLRNTCPAFGFDAKITVDLDGTKLTFTHEREGHRITLTADLATLEFTIC
ncbi:MAG: glycosidase [Lachnospiraceae bacterium]|nr:glycosidase [Lachnospiraceae bacterium]